MRRVSVQTCREGSAAREWLMQWRGWGADLEEKSEVLWQVHVQDLGGKHTLCHWMPVSRTREEWGQSDRAGNEKGVSPRAGAKSDFLILRGKNKTKQ